MVIPAGFEPTACRLGGDRSILLSYGTRGQKTGHLDIIAVFLRVVNLRWKNKRGYGIISLV